jgi:hypothetical protein
VNNEQDLELRPHSERLEANLVVITILDRQRVLVLKSDSRVGEVDAVFAI